MERKFKVVIFVIALIINSLESMPQSVDPFAVIANKVPAVRTHLLTTPQPPLPDTTYLPLKAGNQYAFEPSDKIDTKEELEKELIRIRSAYSLFLKNLAPAIQSTRDTLSLNTFKWREETEADKTDFSTILNGGGKWEEVQIPHYGPPVGEAVTYYYKEFELSGKMLEQESLFIRFKGVDYAAQVFMNGYLLGSHEGFFAPFEFDFTKVARAGINKLLVKVINHQVGAGGEKIYAATGPGFDDPEIGWHHCPPGMGIYQDVFIESRSHLHINDLFMRPVLEKEAVEVWLEINNTRPVQEQIELEYSIYGQNFEKTVCKDVVYIPSTIIVPGVGDLAKATDGKKVPLPMGKGTNFLKFTAGIPQPEIWNNKTPWLYQFQVKIKSVSGEILDVAKKQFGMRSFTMDTVNAPKGKLFLNNEPVRLRGANTMGHLQGCVMRKDWSQLRDDILLAKICNMNFLRLTQRPVQEEIYDYCDKLGLMTQTDLPLFGVLRRTKFAEAVKQAEEMERLVRSHPCNIMVTYINERFPNAEGHPQRSFSEYSGYQKFFTAANQAVHIANPDRVIKPGDGDYDPPSPGLPDSHCYNMWYNGHGLGVGEMLKGYWQPVKPGWFYACGEYGAEGLDPVNTMKKYYPESWLENDKYGNWTPGNISKCQTPAFHIMWYAAQDSKEDWVEASQEYQALATKFTTEAFRRDSRMVSSAIHLFIDAWPAGWMKSIMDVDRQPKKAYFAYRDALSPKMVSIRSDRNKFFSNENIEMEAWICNDENNSLKGATIKYQVEADGTIVFSGEKAAIIPGNLSKFQGLIKWEAPEVDERTTYKIRAAIVDASGVVIHDNEQVIEVFPKGRNTSSKVFTVCKNNGISAAVVNALGAEEAHTLNKASVILVDGEILNDSIINEVAPFVKNGGKLIVFNLPVGNYSIAGSALDVIPTRMGAYYFASTRSGHPIMEKFKPGDFRFWYDEEKDIIAPILSSMIDAEGWNTILKTGIGGRENNRGFVNGKHAVAEKQWGNGVVVISQLLFKNKLQSNPVAIMFLNELLAK